MNLCLVICLDLIFIKEIDMIERKGGNIVVRLPIEVKESNTIVGVSINIEESFRETEKLIIGSLKLNDGTLKIRLLENNKTSKLGHEIIGQEIQVPASNFPGFEGHYSHEIDVYKGSKINPKKRVIKARSGEEYVWKIEFPRGENNAKRIESRWKKKGITIKK